MSWDEGEGSHLTFLHPSGPLIVVCPFDVYLRRYFPFVFYLDTSRLTFFFEIFNIDLPDRSIKVWEYLILKISQISIYGQ